MICSDCGHKNMPGEEFCEECHGDLIAHESKVAQGFQKQILQDVIRKLNPGKPLSLDPGASLAVCIQTMVEHRRGSVVIVNQGSVAGILTERDILKKVAGRIQDLKQAKAAAFMTPNPDTLKMDDTISFAMHKMSVGGYRHIPILQKKELIGIISARDIIRYFADSVKS